MAHVHHCRRHSNVTMCFVKFIFLFFCLLALEVYALNCRTEGGPRDSEYKNIYQKCLKMQSKNTTNRNNEQDWKDSRSNNQKDRDRDRTGDDNRRNNRNDWSGSDSRTGTSDSWMSSSNSRINNNDRNRNDETSSRNDGIGRYDGGGSRYDGLGSRYDGIGNDDRVSSRNDYHGNHEGGGRNDHLNGRNDFQTGEFDDMYQYNGYRSSSQSPRRYKRERRVENTGQRSQYNPNTQRNSGYEDSYRSEEKNSSDNNTNTDNKACALQCFLENLQMTAQDGMPDKYLVAHVITKDVKNDDLRDFLQESIDECFQILENEDSDDKCEFSKNLLLCLSEKGKANCDDWKDDMHF